MILAELCWELEGNSMTEPQDERFGHTNDWAERLLPETQLDRAIEHVQWRCGLLPDKEQELIRSGRKISERSDLLVEEIALIHLTGWDDARMDAM